MTRVLDLRRRQTAVHLNAARALRAMERRAAELLAAADIDDLTPAQGNALVILFEARGPMKATQLADAMNISRVTVGRFLRSLEDNGWITRERDPEDGRAMRIRPTAKSYDLLPKMIGVSNTMLDHAFDGFSDDDIAALADLTDRLWRNIQPCGGDASSEQTPTGTSSTRGQ